MQSSKKRQRKKKSLQRYRALSDNCMENKVFVSKNDRQDRSLTGQVRDQADIASNKMRLILKY